MHWFIAIPTDEHAIRALDGVRALAASLVFLVHFQAAFGHVLRARPRLFHAGEYAAAVGFYGVNVFFVLSGFLIYGSLIARPVTVTRYLRRRVRRIYPTFLVVLAVYLVLSVVVPERSKLPVHGSTLPYVLSNALLLPGVFPIRPIVTVSWSLSFEVCFYALILAVVVGLRLRVWSPRLRVVFWSGMLLAWSVGGLRTQSLVRSFILFVPGILLAEAARSDRVRAALARVPLWTVWLVFGGVVAIQPVLAGETPIGPVHVPLVPSAVLALLLLATATPLFLLRLMVAPRTETVLSREPVRRLGVVSYSFYLSHGLTINGIAALCALDPVERVVRALGPGAYPVLLPLVFGAATVVAFLLFKTVEEPLSIRPS